MGHQELRVPPQNVEAEKSVLGSMLIDNEAIGLVIEILDESWFYEEAHRISMPLSFIFTIIIKCRYHHGFGSLKNRGLRSRRGVTYLSEIIDFVPTSANVEHYAHIVKEKASSVSSFVTQHRLSAKDMNQNGCD